MESRVEVVILAAGYSSRMGECKALMKVGEQTVLEHLIEAFSQGGIQRESIHVVTGHQREKLVPLLSQWGVSEIYNLNFQEGMFSSIQCGLATLLKKGREAPMEGILLTQVDCPLPDSKTIQILVKEALEASKKKGTFSEMLVPTFRGKKGHPVFIPARWFQEILEHQGKMGLKSFLFQRGEEIRFIETQDEGVVLDMDTREDYEEMCHYWKWKQENPGGLARRKSIANSLKKGQRLILIRHFQQIRVGEPILLGQTDPPLSKEGEGMLPICLKELQKLQIKSQRIHTSDLMRAQQTAKLLAEGLENQGKQHMEVKEHPFLREINLGDWDGMPVREIQQQHPQAYVQRGKELAGFKCSPASENFYDLQYRVLKGLVPLVEETESQDVIVVTHDGAIKVLLADYYNVAVDAFFSRCLDYGEITVLEGKED